MAEARSVYFQIGDVINDLEQALKARLVEDDGSLNTQEFEWLRESVRAAVNELEKIRDQVAS